MICNRVSTVRSLSLHACASRNLTLPVFEVTWRCCFCFVFVPENWLWQLTFFGVWILKNTREPTCPNLILYWLESPGIIHLHCILPKRIQVEKKGRINYEIANLPPEVTAHGGNSSLSSQHQHLSSRSKSFLWLNIEKRQWCQGESNQWSIFGLQQTLFAVCEVRQLFNQSNEKHSMIMRLDHSQHCIFLSVFFFSKNRRW